MYEGLHILKMDELVGILSEMPRKRQSIVFIPTAKSDNPNSVLATVADPP